MRTLAIETVETHGSVAVLDGATVVAELALDPGRRSAQSLAPGIQKLLADVGWRPADVQLVAVASGPGSFTGLRIGVTTAKTFAYAVGCQVVGVHTLLAIGARVPGEYAAFQVVLDAQRRELFVADITRDARGELSGGETTRVVGQEEFIASLAAGAVVTGPGLRAGGLNLEQQFVAGVTVVDAEYWAPTAAAVGTLGVRQHAQGLTISPFELVPSYLRRTAAEEQWERRQAGRS